MGTWRGLGGGGKSAAGMLALAVVLAVVPRVRGQNPVPAVAGSPAAAPPAAAAVPSPTPPAAAGTASAPSAAANIAAGGAAVTSPAPNAAPATPFRPPLFLPAATPTPPRLLASVFYTSDGPRGIESFREHAAEVGIVAPQCYSLDRWGWLHGAPPQALMDIARDHHVPVMPLVINRDFSRWQAHDLLDDRDARDHALGQLISHARANGYIGYQIDFEGLWWTDRQAFSRFIAELADGLHRHGFILSVAVAARTGDGGHDNFDGYSGVYDYRRLASEADFLSVMAYPEYNGDDPGPLAGYPWVQQVVQYELRYIPPQKLSLGVPTYQTDWTWRPRRITWLRHVGLELRRFVDWTYHLFASDGQAQAQGSLRWDPVLKSSYRVYGHGVHRHVTWIEDARSFAAKLQLIRQYHLRGFSVWRLGLEDPRIWAILPATAGSVAADEDLAQVRRPHAVTVANRYAPVGRDAFPPPPRRVVHSYLIRRYAPARHYTPAQVAYLRRKEHERYLARLRARRQRVSHVAAERAAAHRRYLERLKARRKYLARLAAERRKDVERQ